MIKLKDILLLIEDLPTNVKDAFGKTAFGSMKNISAMQGKRSTEKNTEFEKELLILLRTWVQQSTNSTAEKLYKRFDILKKAAEVFPTILKPSTPNGTMLYRGLRSANPNIINVLLDANASDFEEVLKDDSNPYSKFYPRWYRYIHPIKYNPRRLVQSWSSTQSVGHKFTDSVIISTTQNDEFLFNQNLMNHLFKKEVEDEVLHFGTDYSKPVYIMISKNFYDEIVKSKNIEYGKIISSSFGFF